MPVHVVDKPIGPTSHDLVARARRLFGTRRVGHAGTLDPLASGVLLLLVGDATKLSQFLVGADKAYLAWVAFGAGTPTLDAEGPVVERADAGDLDAAAVEAALPPFLHLREQRPPAFSAIKRGGEAGYRAARRGETEPPPPRPARYHRVKLLALARRDALPARFGPGDGLWVGRADGRMLELPPPLEALPTALIALEVGSGTYVRAFARDLGAALGLPAHLAGLVRTRVGGVDLARAVPPDALARDAGIAEADALPFPVVALGAAQATRVRQGQRLPAAELGGSGTVALIDPEGRLAAVAELAPEGMRLLRVWPA